MGSKMGLVCPTTLVQREVNEALTKGTVKQSTDHDAEEFVYGRIRVIVNYERPWLSTAYEIGS